MGIVSSISGVICRVPLILCRVLLDYAKRIAGSLGVCSPRGETSISRVVKEVPSPDRHDDSKVTSEDIIHFEAGLKGGIPCAADGVRESAESSGEPQQQAIDPGSHLPEEELDDDYREELPKTIIPTHYQIELVPGLEDGRGNHKFKGLVNISLLVKSNTREIKLNASSIQIETVSLVSNSGSNKVVEVGKWDLDNDKEVLSIALTEELPTNTEWNLMIKYTGIHDDNMAGFYRAAVYDNGVKKYMFSTQFESRHCCKAVPCWDEPAVKCTFGVKLKVPPSMVALSNMDVISENDDPIEDGLKVFEYKTTPKMSTYLLAFVVGELKYVESFTKPRALSGGVTTNAIKCRVYSVPKYVDNGKFALEIACKVLEFFEDYFDVPYPLNKIDQVAIADFSAGAMENWGLITYREAALLFDPSNTSSRFKLRVATTVAHELAHQWFGNLVTMEWWNDLWLNEGFATFASVLVLNELRPEWRPFVEFVIDDLASALSLDALATTHPIDVPIHKASEIDQIFDYISYSKGASIINMIHAYLGKEEFKKSLQYYIKTYAYSNARSINIWKAFDHITNTTLSENMYNWIKKPGYPLITLEDESYDADKRQVILTLKQERYFSSGVPSGKDLDTVWWIPVVIVVYNGKELTYIKHEINSVRSKISFPYTKNEKSYWKINAGTNGLYRVCLKDEQVSMLCEILNNNKSAVSVQDKIGIISDSFAVAKSGHGKFVTALSLIKACKGETDFFVISLVARILSSLAHVLYVRQKSTVEAIHNLTKHIFSDMIKDVGYDHVPGESTIESLKRSVILGALAGAGDEGVISELKKRFKLYISGDKSALYSDIRDVAYSSILKYSENPEEDFKTMLDLYKAAKTPDESIVVLSSLGAVNSTTLVYDLIHKYSLDTEFVRSQDTIYLYKSLSAKNPNIKYSNKIIWEFITSNWDEFYKRYSSSIVLLGYIFTTPIVSQVGNDVIESVKFWIEGKDLQGNANSESALAERTKRLGTIKRDIDQSIEEIQIKTKWVERDAPEIEKWLKEQGFLKV